MNDKETKEVTPYLSRDDLLLAEASATASLQIIRDLYSEALLVPVEDQTTEHFTDILNRYAQQVQDEFDQHDERSQLDIVEEPTRSKADLDSLLSGVEDRLNEKKQKEAQAYLGALAYVEKFHQHLANGRMPDGQGYYHKCRNIIDDYQDKQAGGLK